MIRIEVGGGNAPWSIGRTNLDPVHGKGEWKRYAQDVPWPVNDNSVDFVRASHVMEHIPAGSERIAVMNEVWRILKPGARFEIFVPLLISPDGTVNIHAIADPTHVSYWCEESFRYFESGPNSVTPNADYGIKPWFTFRFGTPREPWEGYWIGTPVKIGYEISGQDILKFSHPEIQELREAENE